MRAITESLELADVRAAVDVLPEEYVAGSNCGTR